jgi:hypothetical protein
MDMLLVWVIGVVPRALLSALTSVVLYNNGGMK